MESVLGVDLRANAKMTSVQKRLDYMLKSTIPILGSIVFFFFGTNWNSIAENLGSVVNIIGATYMTI